MRYVTYKKIKAIRSIISIVFFVLMAVGASMLYYDISKIIFYNSGEDCLAQGRVVEAEGWFTIAGSHGYFQYKDSEIDQRLVQLRNVTELKQFMDNIANDSRKADSSKDAEALLAQYNKYMKEYETQANKGSESKLVFEEISEDCSMEDKFASYFKSARAYLKDMGDKSLSERTFDDENFKSILFKIPDKYYGNSDSKKAEIETIIRDYDSRKIDIILKEKGEAYTIDEAEKIIDYNKKNSCEYGWLIDKMESIWSDVMKYDIDRGDYNSLYNDYYNYGSFINDYLAGSKALAMVDSRIEEDYAAANQYVSDGKYAEAIECYNKIQKFMDVAQNIKDARIRWIEEDPEVVLNDVFPGRSFKNVLFGRDAWEAPAYVLGYDEAGLYLVRLNQDFRYNSSQYSIQGLQSGIRSVRIMGELNYNGPVILIEGPSSSRRAEYIGLVVRGGGFGEIFRFESDGFTVESNSSMVVDNPVGEGEDRQCYYILDDGYFVFSSAKKDYADITLDRINGYKSGKIGFSCTLYKYYSYTDSALVTDGSNYVLLNNVSDMSGSRFYVIGRYAGEGAAMKDGETITVPVVNVLEVQY